MPQASAGTKIVLKNVEVPQASGPLNNLVSWLTGSSSTQQQRDEQKRQNTKLVKEWLDNSGNLPLSCRKPYQELLTTPGTMFWQRQIDICADQAQPRKTLQKSQPDLFVQIAVDARGRFLTERNPIFAVAIELLKQEEAAKGKVYSVAQKIVSKIKKQLTDEERQRALKDAEDQAVKQDSGVKNCADKAKLLRTAIEKFPLAMDCKTLRVANAKQREFQDELDLLAKYDKEYKWEST